LLTMARKRPETSKRRDSLASAAFAAGFFGGLANSPVIRRSTAVGSPFGVAQSQASQLAEASATQRIGIVEPEERIRETIRSLLDPDSNPPSSTASKSPFLKWPIPSVMLAAGVTKFPDERYAVRCDSNNKGSKPMASTKVTGMAHLRIASSQPWVEL
jgi:hypothetical protein